MKLLGIFSAAAAMAATTPPTPEAVKVPSLGPRFKQTRERADVLFKNRDGIMVAPPSAKFNIFRLAVETSPPPPTGNVPPAPPPKPQDSDEKILAEALAFLKKGGGGIVVINGRTHLTFNQKVYIPGDSLLVPLNRGTVSIQIALISHNNVTLALNESETVWRF